MTRPIMVWAVILAFVAAGTAQAVDIETVYTNEFVEQAQ